MKNEYELTQSIRVSDTEFQYNESGPTEGFKEIGYC